MSKISDVLCSDVQSDALQIFVTSWNMGNAQHSGFETVFKEKDALNKFDIFVLGLQESTYSTELDSISHLKGQLEELFKNYFVVKHCYRAQLQLYVFAKNSLKSRISNVEESIENTGFLGVFPNKGGLLVTFHVDGTKFAFVSCHLAAHEGIKYCEARNASIIEILGGVRAGDRRYDITEQFHHVFWMGDMNYRLTYEKDKVPKSTRKNVRQVSVQSVAFDDIEDIDIQMEDESDSESESDDEGVPLTDGEEKSNRSRSPSKSDSSVAKSRLSISQSEIDKLEKKRKNKKYRARTMQMICDGKFEELMQLDELNREIASGRVLNGFTALQPAFYPTFKRTRNLSIQSKHRLVKRQSSNMNSNGNDVVVSDFYNAKRMPSYCDRVLFKSLPTFAKNLRALFFESCENAISSDHKPVRAGFSVSLTKGMNSIRMNQNVLTSEQVDQQHTGGLFRSPSRGNSRNSSGTFSTNPADNIDMSVLKVVISDLKGRKLEDMDLEMFGGGSDPYLIVTTDPPCLQLNHNKKQNSHNPHKYYFTANNEGVKSSVITHNTDPDWKDTLVFHIGSTDFVGLAQNASFVFSVWDEDKYNADDLIGCFTISFKDILMSHANGAKSHNFDAECYSNSEIMGKVSGKITIEGDLQELHNHFLDQSVQEKLISLARAVELTSRDPTLQLQQGAACCSIN